MSEQWSTHDLDDWTIAGIESQGQHPHDWLRHPAETRTWLFKPSRQNRDRGFPEHLIEKIASELATLFGIPAAPVRLASRFEELGALVEDVRPSKWELHAGQVLMPEVMPNYDREDTHRRGHNIQNIQKALARFAAPPNSDLPADFSAFDTFAGYLIFDALIAHGDRHDRNWAVLTPPVGSGERDSLCPSFDHAASLGFTLNDAARARHLRERSVGDWAVKGKATRFEHLPTQPTPTLVQLAERATSRCDPQTRRHWLDRILSVQAGSIDDVFALAPGISAESAEFAAMLVKVNRGRLSHALR